MGYHFHGSITNDFIISFVGSLKLKNDSFDKQINDFGQLSINNSNQSSIDVRKIGCRHLGLNNCSGKKSSSSKNIFIEQFYDNILDICNIDFIYDTINRFSQ